MSKARPKEAPLSSEQAGLPQVTITKVNALDREKKPSPMRPICGSPHHDFNMVLFNQFANCLWTKGAGPEAIHDQMQGALSALHGIGRRDAIRA